MKIISFLNENSGALTVIVTAIYVIATIFIWKANSNSAKVSKAQLDEMRRQFSEEHRPQIEVEFIYEKRAFFGLRFINHGRYTAQNVQIQLAPEFINSILEEKFAQLLQRQNGKKCIIGAGQYYDLFFGSNKYRENPNKIAASGIIRYTCDGIEYTSDFGIDLENYAIIYSVNSEQEDIKKEMSKQTAELKKISQAIQQLQLPLEEESIDA